MLFSIIKGKYWAAELLNSFYKKKRRVSTLARGNPSKIDHIITNFFLSLGEDSGGSASSWLSVCVSTGINYSAYILYVLAEKAVNTENERDP